MRIDIFSDTVCPWCYLGKRRFELALAARPQYEPRVTWRPFELNPGHALGGRGARGVPGRQGRRSRAARRERKQRLVRHGEAVGLQFRFDLIDRMPNTRRSHLLIAHAARHGLQSGGQGAGHARLFRGGLRHRGHRGTGAARASRPASPSARPAPRWFCGQGRTGWSPPSVTPRRSGSRACRPSSSMASTPCPAPRSVDTLARVLDQVAEFAAAREAAP